MKKKITILSGCFNEEENLESFCAEIKKIMDALPQYDWEQLIAENGSTDHSAEILEKIASRDSHVKVIFNLKNYGPDRSGTNLLYHASGDAVICLASDFQDPPEMIPEFIKKWEEGNKVVWGQREKTKEKFLTEMMRKTYYKLIKSMSESVEYERCTGFGLYDREVVDWIKWIDDPEPFIRNIVTSLGYTPYLLPCERRQRRAGRSSYSFFGYLNDALLSMITSTKMPLRFATYLGGIVAMVSFLIGVVYLVMKLLRWYEFDAGMAPLVVGLFFLGAVQLICIGIVGEYVGAVLTRVRRRPLVVARKMMNFQEDSRSEEKKHNVVEEKMEDRTCRFETQSEPRE